MNINFEKKDGTYQAEIKLSDASAIHIEKSKQGPFYIEKSHSEDGGYVDATKDTKSFVTDTLDFTVTDDVYPVYLRMTSTVPVDLAMASDGVELIIDYSDKFMCVYGDEYGDGLYYTYIPFLKIDDDTISPLVYRPYDDEIEYVDIYSGEGDFWISDSGKGELRAQDIGLYSQLLKFPYSICDTSNMIESTKILHKNFIKNKNTCESYYLDGQPITFFTLKMTGPNEQIIQIPFINHGDELRTLYVPYNDDKFLVTCNEYSCSLAPEDAKAIVNTICDHLPSDFPYTIDSEYMIEFTEMTSAMYHNAYSNDEVEFYEIDMSNVLFG